MTTPRMITVDWLKSNNACPDAINLFCAEWPDGGEVTHANLLRADTLGLSLEWFAKRVLPEEVYADYLAKGPVLDADYTDTRSALIANYLSNRSALLIPALLNHFAALPAKQRREETK